MVLVHVMKRNGLVSKSFYFSLCLFIHLLINFLFPIVIGLSEDILVTSVALANYEKYSSTVKEFQLLASTSFPTEEWINLGVYEAAARLGEQYFNVTTSSVHTRYLKFKFLTHYDNEALCTLSQIKVHGTTVIASFKEEVERSDTLMRDMLSQLSLENTDDPDTDISASNSSTVESVVTDDSAANTNQTEVVNIGDNVTIGDAASEVAINESVSIETEEATSNSESGDNVTEIGDVLVETENLSKEDTTDSSDDTSGTITDVEANNNATLDASTADDSTIDSNNNLGTTLMSVLPESAVNFVKEIVLSPLGIMTSGDEDEPVVEKTEEDIDNDHLGVSTPSDIDIPIESETLPSTVTIDDLDLVDATISPSDISTMEHVANNATSEILTPVNNTVSQQEAASIGENLSDHGNGFNGTSAALPEERVVSTNLGTDNSSSVLMDAANISHTSVQVNNTDDGLVELVRDNASATITANVSVPVVPVLPVQSINNNRDASPSISLSCWDQLRFSDFQTKMLSKLQKNSTETSGDGSTSSSVSMLSSSQDNVFRQLMQKIKTLEMGYAIIEMYSTQVSDCYRLVMSDMMVNINDTKASLAVSTAKVKELEQIIEESRKTIKYDVFDSFSISFSHRDMVLGMIMVTMVSLVSLIVSLMVILLIKSKKWYTIDTDDEK